MADMGSKGGDSDEIRGWLGLEGNGNVYGQCSFVGE